MNDQPASRQFHDRIRIGRRRRGAGSPGRVAHPGLDELDFLGRPPALDSEKLQAVRDFQDLSLMSKMDGINDKVDGIRDDRSRTAFTVSIQRRPIRSMATTTRISPETRWALRARQPARLLVPVPPETPTSR